MLKTSHPKRFTKIALIDTDTYRVLASTDVNEVRDRDLGRRLRGRLAHKHGGRALKMDSKDGSRALAITSPISFSQNRNSPAAMLVAFLDLQLFFR